MLRQRRAKQLALQLQDTMDVSKARRVIGARRLKTKPSMYAGAMIGGGARQYRTKEGRLTPAHPGYREFGMVKKNPCEKRKERRSVLLAKGKVNRPGGAPGPYKPRSKIRWRC